MRIRSYNFARLCAILSNIFLPVINEAGLPPVAFAATLPEVRATDAAAFLHSIGVNTHVDQGYDPRSYIAPLKYTGIRQVRDGARNIAGNLMIHERTGVTYTINAGGDLRAMLAAAKALANAHALLALEGPNEPGNFPITYDDKSGGGSNASWAAVAEFQKTLYQIAKSDDLLKHYPVFGPSETGAEFDNFGLQFLVVPPGSSTLSPVGTRFADYANVHNYVIGNGNLYEDNQAWNAADPVLNDRWDSLYGNNGLTWLKHYQGYTVRELPKLDRVTTETGWDTALNPGGERTQGTVLTNTYLAQFKRGWAYTFVYELEDGEGGEGNGGLYHGTTPKQAAVYLHNMTTILSDDEPVPHPGSLRYAIPGQPVSVHDLLLQKSDGRFELIVWDERAQGSDTVKILLGGPRKSVSVYDITAGTSPAFTLTNPVSLNLTLSDHAMIIEIEFKGR